MDFPRVEKRSWASQIHGLRYLIDHIKQNWLASMDAHLAIVVNGMTGVEGHELDDKLLRMQAEEKQMIDQIIGTSNDPNQNI